MSEEKIKELENRMSELQEKVRKNEEEIKELKRKISDLSEPPRYTYEGERIG